MICGGHGPKKIPSSPAHQLPTRATEESELKGCKKLGDLCIGDKDGDDRYDAGEKVGVMDPVFNVTQGNVAAPDVFERTAHNTLDDLLSQSLVGLKLKPAQQFLEAAKKLEEIARGEEEIAGEEETNRSEMIKLIDMLEAHAKAAGILKSKFGQAQFKTLYGNIRAVLKTEEAASLSEPVLDVLIDREVGNKPGARESDGVDPDSLPQADPSWSDSDGDSF